LGADGLIHKESLRDWRRVGETRGLDNDGVKFAFSPHQPVDDADEVTAHRAADTAVVHFEHFFVGVDHKFVVDAYLTKLVHDHGELLAVRLGQDAVKQRGLSGSEIAGEHGDGDFSGRVGDGHEAAPFRKYI